LARLEWYCDLPRYGNHAGAFYCRCCHAGVIRGRGESSCVATCSRRAKPPCSARSPRDSAIQPAPLLVLIIFDDVAKALEFDEKGFRQVVSNIAGLKDKLAPAAQKCLAYFPGWNRTNERRIVACESAGSMCPHAEGSGCKIAERARLLHAGSRRKRINSVQPEETKVNHCFNGSAGWGPFEVANVEGIKEFL
jgi:hypothetical protein